MSKLYTESEVRKAIKLAQECDSDCGGVYFYSTETQVIDELTPIELPSDEEIEEVAEKTLSVNFLSFIEGAKWMRDKIKGGEQC